MANSQVISGNRVKTWKKDFLYEYHRKDRFTQEMSKNGMKPIHVLDDLGKGDGDTVVVSQVGQLTSDGVSGSETLKGNEENSRNFKYEMTIDDHANAVKLHKNEARKPAFDLLKANKTPLMNWGQSHRRTKIIGALGSAKTDGVTPYADCSETEKDTWVAAQNPAAGNHRVLFGNSTSNYSSGDHSASLAAVTTAMTISTSLVSQMRRMARACDPIVPPFIMDGEEFYICYTDMLNMKVFKESSAYQTILREADQRGRNNKIFKPGDLYYDGVIIREIPEIPTLGAVGDGNQYVSPAYLCGQQAVAIVYGQHPTPIRDSDDYGRQNGIGIEFAYQVGKPNFQNSRQHGVLTGYFAATPD